MLKSRSCRESGGHTKLALRQPRQGCNKGLGVSQLARVTFGVRQTAHDIMDSGGELGGGRGREAQWDMAVPSNGL